MTLLLGIRGPAIYKLIEVPDADVAAAIDPTTGWAMEMTEGTVIPWDPNAPLGADWKVPGYHIPAELTGEPIDPDPPDPPDPPEAPLPLPIASISNSVPTSVLLTNKSDIANFTEGDTVTIAGALGNFAVVNGPHVIHSVSAQLGNFLLTGVDTSAEPTNATDAGMTVTPAAPPPAARTASRRRR